MKNSITSPAISKSAHFQEGSDSALRGLIKSKAGRLAALVLAVLAAAPNAACGGEEPEQEIPAYCDLPPNPDLTADSSDPTDPDQEFGPPTRPTIEQPEIVSTDISHIRVRATVGFRCAPAQVDILAKFRYADPLQPGKADPGEIALDCGLFSQTGEHEFSAEVPTRIFGRRVAGVEQARLKVTEAGRDGKSYTISSHLDVPGRGPGPAPEGPPQN